MVFSAGMSLNLRHAFFAKSLDARTKGEEIRWSEHRSILSADRPRELYLTSYSQYPSRSSIIVISTSIFRRSGSPSMLYSNRGNRPEHRSNRFKAVPRPAYEPPTITTLNGLACRAKLVTAMLMIVEKVAEALKLGERDVHFEDPHIVGLLS